MRPIHILPAIFLVAACLPGKDKVPEVTALPGTPEYFEQQSEICTAKGGDFRPGPGKSTMVCYETPADANKNCSQKSDCSGVCLARSRTCAPVKPLFGCNEVLVDGGLKATVCVD